MASSTCPACSADAFVPAASGDGGACSRCGYASGEANRCPHCGALARIEGAGERAVCAVCGGPRIASNLGGDDAANALREQKAALAKARLASVATVAQAALAALATLIGLALAPSSIAGNAVVILVAALPLLVALRSRSQATRARATAKDASDRAWRSAAEDLAARSPGGVTVAGLAKALGITTEHADRLLTELAVHDRTRIDVGDDAEIRYSAAPGPRVSMEDLPDEHALAEDAESSERGRAR